MWLPVGLMSATSKSQMFNLGKPKDYSRLLSEIKERIRTAQYEVLKDTVYNYDLMHYEFEEVIEE